MAVYYPNAPYPMTQSEYDAWAQGGFAPFQAPGVQRNIPLPGTPDYNDPAFNLLQRPTAPGGALPGEVSASGAAPPPAATTPTNFAPTGAQVAANPSTYAGTSFDPRNQASNQIPNGVLATHTALPGQGFNTWQPGMGTPNSPPPGAFQIRPGEWMLPTGNTWTTPGATPQLPEYRLGGEDELVRNVLGQISAQLAQNPGSITQQQAEAMLRNAAEINANLRQQRDALRSAGNLNGAGYDQVKLPTVNAQGQLTFPGASATGGGTTAGTGAAPPNPLLGSESWQKYNMALNKAVLDKLPPSLTAGIKLDDPNTILAIQAQLDRARQSFGLPTSQQIMSGRGAQTDPNWFAYDPLGWGAAAPYMPDVAPAKDFRYSWMPELASGAGAWGMHYTGAAPTNQTGLDSFLTTLNSLGAANIRGLPEGFQFANAATGPTWRWNGPAFAPATTTTTGTQATGGSGSSINDLIAALFGGGGGGGGGGYEPDPKTGWFPGQGQGQTQQQSTSTGSLANAFTTPTTATTTAAATDPWASLTNRPQDKPSPGTNLWG